MQRGLLETQRIHASGARGDKHKLLPCTKDKDYLPLGYRRGYVE